MATAKTKPAAEPQAPDVATQPQAISEALPQTGGSFVRQPDGQLQPEPTETTDPLQE